MPVRATLVAIVLALSATACGPIVSGVQIVNANVALSAATTAGAEKYAVYEYTAANEYLHKAREENGYSDFWAARLYADRAFELAVQAKKKAVAASRAEQPASLPPTVAPPPAGTLPSTSPDVTTTQAHPTL